MSTGNYCRYCTWLESGVEDRACVHAKMKFGNVGFEVPICVKPWLRIMTRVPESA